MPSLLVAHHRPGFYLRVLEEGLVQPGEPIVKVADGPEGLTIAQVGALLYLPNESRPQLERALRIPALSDGLEAELPGAAGEVRRRGEAAGVGGLPAAARRGDPPRERDRHLGLADAHR
jgi:hypothetical protein